MSNNALYGQQSTLGASDLNLHISIEDQIKKFPPYRRELINRLSGKNFKNDVVSHKYEWSTRDNRKLETTLAVPMGNGATSMIVADSGVLNVDDVFTLGSGPTAPQFYVERVDAGINIVFRKISGTQASSYAGGTNVTIVGMGTPQGKDADNMVITPFEDLYNFVSNFEDVVDLSDMENAALIRGDEGSAALLARKGMELTQKLQRSLVASRRTQDKARKQTTMGGMIDMIDLYAPENAIDFGGDIWASDRAVQDKLDDALDIIADRAFEKPVMYVTPAFMRKFKYIQDDTTQTMGFKTKDRGVGVVKEYNSHTFGAIDVVQLQGMGHVMDDLVIIVDESMIGYKPYKGLGWHTYQLGRRGQSFQWQVAGVYTFKMDIPQAAVYLYNLGLD